jgi:hypothetical protein
MGKRTILMWLLGNVLNANFLLLQHTFAVFRKRVEQKRRIREKVKDADAR